MENNGVDKGIMGDLGFPVLSVGYTTDEEAVGQQKAFEYLIRKEVIDPEADTEVIKNSLREMRVIKMVEYGTGEAIDVFDFVHTNPSVILAFTRAIKGIQIQRLVDAVITDPRIGLDDFDIFFTVAGNQCRTSMLLKEDARRRISARVNGSRPGTVNSRVTKLAEGGMILRSFFCNDQTVTPQRSVAIYTASRFYETWRLQSISGTSLSVDSDIAESTSNGIMQHSSDRVITEVTSRALQSGQLSMPDMVTKSDKAMNLLSAMTPAVCQEYLDRSEQKSVAYYAHCQRRGYGPTPTTNDEEDNSAVYEYALTLAGMAAKEIIDRNADQSANTGFVSPRLSAQMVNILNDPYGPLNNIYAPNQAFLNIMLFEKGVIDQFAESEPFLPNVKLSISFIRDACFAIMKQKITSEQGFEQIRHNCDRTLACFCMLEPADVYPCQCPDCRNGRADGTLTKEMEVEKEIKYRTLFLYMSDAVDKGFDPMQAFGKVAGLSVNTDPTVISGTKKQVLSQLSTMLGGIIKGNPLNREVKRQVKKSSKKRGDGKQKGE